MIQATIEGTIVAIWLISEVSRCRSISDRRDDLLTSDYRDARHCSARCDCRSVRDAIVAANFQSGRPMSSNVTWVAFGFLGVIWVVRICLLPTN